MIDSREDEKKARFAMYYVPVPVKKQRENEMFTDFELTVDHRTMLTHLDEIEIVNKLTQKAYSSGKRLNSRQVLIFSKNLRSNEGKKFFFSSMGKYFVSLDLKAITSILASVQDSETRGVAIEGMGTSLRNLNQDDKTTFLGLFQEDPINQRRIRRLLNIW